MLRRSVRIGRHVSADLIAHCWLNCYSATQCKVMQPLAALALQLIPPPVSHESRHPVQSNSATETRRFEAPIENRLRSGPVARSCQKSRFRGGSTTNGRNASAPHFEQWGFGTQPGKASLLPASKLKVFSENLFKSAASLVAWSAVLDISLTSGTSRASAAPAPSRTTRPRNLLSPARPLDSSANPCSRSARAEVRQPTETAHIPETQE
jgi:hypothetical protein